MQAFPVILAVFVAAAAIIAVLLWRIKPQSTANSDAADKRTAEEVEKVRALQAKLDSKDKALTDALVAASAAKATTEATNARAAAAETNEERIKADLSVLQRKYSDVEPLVATATEQKKAAEEARAEIVKRLADSTSHQALLQRDLNLMADRAAKAEKDSAAARAEAEAVRQRAEASEARLNETIAKIDDLRVDLSRMKPLVAEATAQRDAAEMSKAETEQRFAALVVKHDALTEEHKTALSGAATAKNEAENVHVRNGEILRAYETIVQELDAAKRELVEAAAKQQTNEDSTRHFESISQAVLKEVMGEAKRGVSELAATIQKTSGEELSKHADKVARTLEPLQSKLEAYDKSIKSMEEVSHKTFGGLTNQISELQRAEQSLHNQAKALTAALSDSPKMRGNYGELTLKRLVEHAGMEERCHFEAQASRETEDGRKIPDMVFSLPGGQKVVVDAKAVLNACTEAYEAQEESQRTILLKKHCENIRSRVSELSAKNYFVNHSDAVESVLLFLPAENLYIAAMMTDPGLTDYAAARKVTICGPNSLILLLRVANQLWSRASIEKEAEDIKKCGEDIYNAACNFVEKFSGIGKKIEALETEYNGAMATFEVSPPPGRQAHEHLRGRRTEQRDGGTLAGKG